MPIINVPSNTTHLMPSTLPLSEWLGNVAAVVGAQDDPGEVRALAAIHSALNWLTHLDWDWFMTNATFDSVVGTATYTVPSRCRDIISLRCSTPSGTERPIMPVRKDIYNRIRYEQTSTGLPVHYSLDLFGDQKLLRLLPSPDQVESFQMLYYREPAKETNEALALDISEHMEEPLLLRAQALVGQWRAKGSGWVERQVVMAEQARSAAWAQDSIHYDEDVRIVAFDEWANANWPWTHPNFRELE